MAPSRRRRKHRKLRLLLLAFLGLLVAPIVATFVLAAWIVVLGHLTEALVLAALVTAAVTVFLVVTHSLEKLPR